MLSLSSFKKRLQHVLVLGIILSCLAVPTVLNAQFETGIPGTDIVNPGGPGVGSSGSSWSGCDSWWKPLVRPIDCLLAPGIVAIFGGVIMGVSGMALEFSGYLFDILVSTFVVAFAGTLGSLGMIDGIHTGWTVLRDISNIVIIGMFTFIAISIIIGNHTFGE